MKISEARRSDMLSRLLGGLWRKLGSQGNSATDCSLLSQAQERELLDLPRFQPGVVSTAIGQIAYVDPCTLVVGSREIFCQKCYAVQDTGSMTIIDCGANIGLSVIWFAMQYPNATIIAYEPDPEIFKILSRNIHLMGLHERVSLRNAAIWTDDRGMSFECEGGASGRLAIDRQAFNDRRVAKVNTRSLAALLHESGPVDLLKIDIEGAENQVLLMPGLDLSAVKNLFLEYHSTSLLPQELPEILTKLKQHGYRIYVKEARAPKHPFISRDSVEGMDMQLNIYAVRD